MRIFVYEYASAQPEGADLPASVRREGRAMLEAIVEDFSRVPAVEVRTLRPQPLWQEEAAFSAFSGSSDWTLVIAPEFDHNLEERCRWVQRCGGRLIGSSHRVVRKAADKLTAHHFLDQAEVPVPRTWLAAPGSRSEWPAPCVHKRRWGGGSLGIRLLAEPSTISPSNLALVQEYIPGQPASIALIIGRRQTITLAACSQKLSQDGRFRYLGGEAPLPRNLSQRAVSLGLRATAAVVGLKGYVGVDLVLGEALDGSEDRVIEINPRLTTSYIGLRALAIDNLAEVMLRLAEGKTVTPIRWREGALRFEANGSVEFVTSYPRGSQSLAPRRDGF